MQESSKHVVLKLLETLRPGSILDCPSGSGWLGQRLPEGVIVDGIDLYAETRGRYRWVIAADLDNGIPPELGTYDVIACCEGIEHFGNPELFLRTARQHLNPGGTLVVTTPNVWYPEARVQYFLRGFFPGFSCLVGRIQRGTHMHIMPWSFPQLYLYLILTEFTAIRLHAEPLSRPKHWFERLLGWPQRLYCAYKARQSQDAETRRFWCVAGSPAAVYGRHLIVTARPACVAGPARVGTLK